MRWQDQTWSEPFWYKGKVARRRFIGRSAVAGALGAQMLVPAPWRGVFGQTRPYKPGTLQALTGPAAPEGRMSLIGTELAVRRVNASGGINGRPVELIVEDDESSPKIALLKAEKLVMRDAVDAHQGGFLSDVCLQCMSLWERHTIVNIIRSEEHTSELQSLRHLVC